MRVVEVFRSIQGEGTRAGEVSAFVRLAGCPVRCAYCDTSYAWDGGQELSVAQVVARVEGLGCKAMTVTGGEPMADPDTPHLLSALLDAGHEVTLFTSGCCPLYDVPQAVHIVLDMKTPWVHEAGVPGDQRPGAPPPFLAPGALERLGRSDEVKFVVRSRVEFEWVVDFATSARLFDRVGAVLVGPVWGSLDPAVLADWLVASNLPFRLNLQLHKYLFGDTPGR